MQQLPNGACHHASAMTQGLGFPFYVSVWLTSLSQLHDGTAASRRVWHRFCGYKADDCRHRRVDRCEGQQSFCHYHRWARAFFSVALTLCFILQLRFSFEELFAKEIPVAFAIDWRQSSDGNLSDAIQDKVGRGWAEPAFRNTICNSAGKFSISIEQLKTSGIHELLELVRFYMPQGSVVLLPYRDSVKYSDPMWSSAISISSFAAWHFSLPGPLGAS